ncbi:hypothetical protein PAPYR_12957 [Paratrimastix pyriformis]|uniref:Uncharacterized protein n=1 Tax=Paratrimastix pyriformis TaxID=342808 RepID=A0ABQ8U114_9EUKA|nr:hypothetical protein PAPYR_12957 [Paratrimastix pyriformis]
MFVGTKIHTGDELDRLEPVPHPQEAIEYCEGAIGQDPRNGPRVTRRSIASVDASPPLTQPLGAGLMTPYHLELIRQTFDGLFRPSSPDSAGKDLLLDIGGEEDEPEREEPSSPAPPPRTPHQERPCPDPYRPEGPDRPDRSILDDDDVPSPPKPKKAAPAAAKPKKDREAPKKARRRPRWPPRRPCPEPKAKAERKRARPTDPDDFSPEAARQVLQSVVDLVNAYLARHPLLPPRSPSNAVRR